MNILLLVFLPFIIVGIFYLYELFKSSNKFTTKILSKLKRFKRKLVKELADIEEKIEQLELEIKSIPDFNEFKDILEMKKKLKESLIENKNLIKDNLTKEFLESIPVFVYNKMTDESIKRMENNKEILDVYSLICEQTFNKKDFVLVTREDLEKLKTLIVDEKLNKYGYEDIELKFDALMLAEEFEYGITRFLNEKYLKRNGNE